MREIRAARPRVKGDRASRVGATVTPAEIEEAMVYTAYLVEKYGDAYAPVLDRLIADHEEAQRQGTPRDRARRVLDAYGPVSR